MILGPPSNEVSCVAGNPWPDYPETGTEILIVIADSIQGKADGETLINSEASNDVQDLSGTDPLLTLGGSGGSALYRDSGKNGQPYIELPGTRYIASGLHEDHPGADDTYVVFTVGLITEAPTHLDVLMSGQSSNDVVWWYQTGGISRWTLYNGTSPGITIDEEANFFSGDWWLTKLHNKRSNESTFTRNGSLRAIGTFSGNAITNLFVGVGLGCNVASHIALKNPTDQDIATWEDYLKAKYAFSY